MAAPRLRVLDDSWGLESRRSQRALLSAEKVMLEELDAAAARATDTVLLALTGIKAPESAKMAALAVVQRAAEQYRADSAAAVWRGRQAARMAALERLRAELDRAARQLGVDPMDLPPQSDSAEDAALSQAAGDTLAGAWRAGVTAAVLAWADSPKNSLAERVRLVTRGAAYRRQRIAVTENARAFNDEHGEGLAWVAANYSLTGQRLQPPRSQAVELSPAVSEAARLGVSGAEYQRVHAFGRNLTREERLRRALRRGPEDTPTLADADVQDADVGGLPAWARPLVGRMLQRWDATLDSRTCAFCHSMNGALTLLGRPFPNGYEPGMPHPHCRCLSTLVVLTPQVILENEKRAALKTTAAVKFERKLAPHVRSESGVQSTDSPQAIKLSRHQRRTRAHVDTVLDVDRKEEA